VISWKTRPQNAIRNTLFIGFRSRHKKNRSLCFNSEGTVLSGGQGAEPVTFRHLFNRSNQQPRSKFYSVVDRKSAGELVYKQRVNKLVNILFIIFRKILARFSQLFQIVYCKIAIKRNDKLHLVINCLFLTKTWHS
jgi:hypothetical protein